MIRPDELVFNIAEHDNNTVSSVLDLLEYELKCL